MKEGVFFTILGLVFAGYFVFLGFLPMILQPPVIPDKIDEIEKDYLTLNYGTNPGAKITIVEYMDIECPNCRSAQPLIEWAEEEYNANLVIKHFPSEIHKNALLAARYAVCAEKQGKYIAFLKNVYNEPGTAGKREANGETNRQELNKENILEAALKTEVDQRQYLGCLEEDETTKRIERDVEEGILRGVKGTPTIFVNGKKFEGMPGDYEFRNIVRSIAEG